MTADDASATGRFHADHCASCGLDFRTDPYTGVCPGCDLWPDSCVCKPVTPASEPASRPMIEDRWIDWFLILLVMVLLGLVVLWRVW